MTVNDVCRKFRNTIMKEIYNFYVVQKTLIMVSTSQIKVSSPPLDEAFNIQGEYLNDYLKVRDKVEIKQNLVYLGTLFETFMKEYIGEKNGVEYSDSIKKSINDTLKNNSLYQNPHNQSFLNPHYCMAIMEGIYNYDINSSVKIGTISSDTFEKDWDLIKDIKSEEELLKTLNSQQGQKDISEKKLISDLFFEFGELRKLLVHYNGQISNVPSNRQAQFRTNLQKHFNNGYIKNDEVELTLDLIMEHVISAYNFIICSEELSS